MVIHQGLKKAFIAVIRLYQLAISGFLGHCCRFTPTCSEYTIVAIERHGILKGLYGSLRRLLRCHPWHAGGFDPVPTHSSPINHSSEVKKLC